MRRSEGGKGEMAKYETKKSDTEESDEFEDYNKILENSLNFLVKYDHF